jgi:enoyl-CoA hydratase/carnithine racemase
MTESVTFTIDDAATVTPNQPRKGNPLIPGTSTALQARLEDITDSEARCVVIQGAGSAFSPGGDISVMQDSLTSGAPGSDRLETISAVSDGVAAVANV